MNKKSWLQLVIAWLKARCKVIMLFLLIAGIYGVVLYLYHQPYEVISYCQFLAVIIFAFAGVIDFYYYKKKYQRLLDLYDNIEWHMPEPITTNNSIEAGYEQIICKQYELIKKRKNANEEQIQEMNDYYTLWAHQIKTPIAAMRLLLADLELDDESSYQLENELFRIEQYAEMVLQYLRLESMASDKVIKYYDLEKLVRASVRKYAKSFISRKISLDFQSFTAKVLSDEKWLSFVIEQLLSNSIKYTAVGGKISIQCEENEEEVRLILQDNGIGIREEDLPRVYDRGFTGFNGRMDKRSTGIGLYLCKEITRRLAHEIHITSKVGVGTKVMLCFKKEA